MQINPINRDEKWCESIKAIKKISKSNLLFILSIDLDLINEYNKNTKKTNANP